MGTQNDTDKLEAKEIQCFFFQTILFGQIIATSAEVTQNGSLVRESPNNALNSGLGIIVIWPDPFWHQFVKVSGGSILYLQPTLSQQIFPPPQNT